MQCICKKCQKEFGMEPIEVSDKTVCMCVQPDSSKREDSCKHQWGSEEYDSRGPFYICSKCDCEMRYSEHDGNIVREVQ
jgi:hypothetical protein